MEENKRLINEVIALYTLESALKDIYVEGPLDRCVYNNYIQSNKLSVNCLLIDSVDFTEVSSEYIESLDPKANKDKIILLSRVLSSMKTEAKIACVADSDLDKYTIGIETNEFLWRTDFSCLESYYYDGSILDRFLTFCFQNMSFNGAHIVDELAPVLKFFYALRIARFVIDKSLILPSVSKMVDIDKKKGKVNWDKKHILDVVYKNNKIKDAHVRSVFDSKVNQYLDEVKEADIRYTINGHDFVDLLYHFLNCIKNTNNYKVDNFHRTLLLGGESADFHQYQLFQKIKEL